MKRTCVDCTSDTTARSPRCRPCQVAHKRQQDHDYHSARYRPSRYEQPCVQCATTIISRFPKRYCSIACKKRFNYSPARRRAEFLRHREHINEHARRRWRNDPTVSLDRSRVRVSAFPAELQPIARLVMETRRELRRTA